MTRPHPIFTPSAVDPERLEAITVGRKPLLERLTQRLIMAASSSSRPHTLIIGPRGSGKTHLLHIVVRRALENTSEGGRLIPLWVPEDSLAIGNYSDLLLELIRSATADIERGKELRRQKDSHALERILVGAAADRVIVIVIENLDRVFESIGAAGQASLRGLIETEGCFLILASAPLLFSGVSSREQSWYGSFDVEHLSDLTVEDGQELMTRAARESGDTELANYLGTPDGLARLAAVRELAGGSPRLWHILSGCVTAQSLDELIPAVETLLDRLAPYYQQRLWELPPGEQRLVIELARGFGARTVSDLAESTGVSNQAAATSLGRLAKSRWVNSTKASTGDQRAAWYELSEPLLRHHLQYREEHGEPLSLIVEFLRLFYSQEQRTSQVLNATPGSIAERHLIHSLTSRPGESYVANLNSATDLLVAARFWINGQAGDRSPSPALGIAVEAVVLAALDQENLRIDVPDRIASAIDSVVATAATEDSFRGRFVSGIRALSRLDWPEVDSDTLLLLDASYTGARLSDDEFAHLDGLVRRAGRSVSGLDLGFRVEHAYQIGMYRDDPRAGLRLLERLETNIPPSLSWTDHTHVYTFMNWFWIVRQFSKNSYEGRLYIEELETRKDPPFNVATIIGISEEIAQNGNTKLSELNEFYEVVPVRRRREFALALLISRASLGYDIMGFDSIWTPMDHDSRRWVRTIMDAIDGDDSMLLRIPIEMQSKITAIRQRRITQRKAAT